MHTGWQNELKNYEHLHPAYYNIKDTVTSVCLKPMVLSHHSILAFKFHSRKKDCHSI